MTSYRLWPRYYRHFVDIINTIYFVELRGEDLVCYSNKIKSVYLRKCLYDHLLINKAYLGDITATNIYKMAAKTSWHRCGTKLRHCQPMYIVYRVMC